jgi:hypothetical protein
LGHARRIGEGLVLLEAGIEQSETGWLTPELLRLKGELLLMQSTPAVVEPVEDLFRQALEEPRRQQALGAARRVKATTILQPVRCRRPDRGETAIG